MGVGIFPAQLDGDGASGSIGAEGEANRAMTSRVEVRFSLKSFLGLIHTCGNGIARFERFEIQKFWWKFQLFGCP
jgi:hypothetical protein